MVYEPTQEQPRVKQPVKEKQPSPEEVRAAELRRLREWKDPSGLKLSPDQVFGILNGQIEDPTLKPQPKLPRLRFDNTKAILDQFNMKPVNNGEKRLPVLYRHNRRPEDPRPLPHANAGSIRRASEHRALRDVSQSKEEARREYWVRLKDRLSRGAVATSEKPKQDDKGKVLKFPSAPPEEKSIS